MSTWSVLATILILHVHNAQQETKILKYISIISCMSSKKNNSAAVDPITHPEPKNDGEHEINEDTEKGERCNQSDGNVVYTPEKAASILDMVFFWVFFISALILNLWFLIVITSYEGETPRTCLS